ncbi:hypothetical protein C1645_841677 [Glomus cerebriforme]|uniref:AIG1-type G domain-containing protein n=1 Tax=Glomus cerebriforme TaxID=658196 RepID=A0A397RZC9_9GLOM|nr:hypothetical protein C1645_841677 [Glomus cerebriforme]
MNNDELFRQQYREYLGVEAEEENEEELLSKAIALSLEDNDDNSNGKVKNILLIGRTGSGKSTLGNVLVNKDGEFKEVFRESNGSVSETKHIQVEKFTLDVSRDGTEKIDYLVIDTAGFGDTQLNQKETLQLLKELVPIIKKNGINQIFLVNNGRFKEEIDIYRMLEEILFDKNAANYTTIVRTNFPRFKNESICEEDRRRLQTENDEIARILRTSRIIYVDNPSLELGEDEEDMKLIEINKKTRQESRKRLLTYLGTCLDSYKSTNLDTLGERIDNFMSQEEKLNQEIAEKEQEIREREAELQKEVKEIEKQKSRDLRITGRNFERQVQELKTQSQKKIQATRQELGEVHQERLQNSQQTYDREVNRLNQTIQSNLSTIRNSYNNVRVGEPVCSRGHDSNIRTYDRSGYLIPGHRTGFIGHIYCPTCGTEERIRRMNEAIEEQNRKEREIINRLNQERINRNNQADQDLRERERLEQQILDQEQRIHEERLRSNRLDSEGRVKRDSQEREDNLTRELERKKQELRDHVREAEARKNEAKQELFAYIGQNLK